MLDKISQLAHCIKNQEGSVSGATGHLQPYLNNYLYNHIDSLAYCFQGVQILLGENNFKYFGRLYLLNETPNSANIDLFGSKFPNFLTGIAELKEIPYIQDLATLDYFWAHGNQNDGIEIAQGVLKLWQGLLEGEIPDSLEIQLEQKERIQKIYEANELYLVAQDV